MYRRFMFPSNDKLEPSCRQGIMGELERLHITRYKTDDKDSEWHSSIRK